jgi:hypothetical protein
MSANPSEATTAVPSIAADDEGRPLLARPRVVITDSVPGRRVREPITFSIPLEVTDDLWLAEASDGSRVVCQKLTACSTPGQTTFITVLSFEGHVELALTGPANEMPAGIHKLPAQELDAFVRLDTGYFDLEICSGTARGTGGSKWGIRHFRALHENIDLLPSGNNAIGGFYGPFFTPENGLINPPEHTLVDIEVVERGPIMHRYRMHGTVPDGLLDELKNKHFSIDWTFTYGTPYFKRVYSVDSFQTVINGRSVTDKITVGDEFEGGPGRLVFDRFEAFGGTRYREGDPYAEQLANMVADTLSSSTSTTPTFETFRAQLRGDIETAHWDLYWRLFCAWEKALEIDEIQRRLAFVRAASHVLADLPGRAWQIASGPVDVARAQDETIFAGPATKTAELNTQTGQSMVWWTSRASGAFQIVQRRQSGWVNWGTNGENECPELPVGVEIKTAYGPFGERWCTMANQLESPPTVTIL